MVEVKFDRLYLIKPDPTVSEEEEGEKVELPPENDWDTVDMSEVDVDAAIAPLKEGLPLPVISLLDLFLKGASSLALNLKESQYWKKQSNRRYLG